jgi:hypothetical protein
MLCWDECYMFGAVIDYSTNWASISFTKKVWLDNYRSYYTDY